MRNVKGKGLTPSFLINNTSQKKCKQSSRQEIMKRSISPNPCFNPRGSQTTHGLTDIKYSSNTPGFPPAHTREPATDENQLSSTRASFKTHNSRIKVSTTQVNSPRPLSDTAPCSNSAISSNTTLRKDTVYYWICDTEAIKYLLLIFLNATFFVAYPIQGAKYSHFWLQDRP